MASDDIDRLLWEIGNGDIDQPGHTPMPRSDQQSSAQNLIRADPYLQPANYAAPSVPSFLHSTSRQAATRAGDLDAFDQELLHQPRYDWAASNGRTRISLPPRFSGSNIAPPLARATGEREYDQQLAIQDSLGHGTTTSRPDRGFVEQSSQPRFPRPSLQRDLSSSPLGLPSSPTFSVSQRHNGTRAHNNSSYSNTSCGVFSSPQSRPEPQPRPTPQTLALAHAPPLAQGIQLISLNDLPDRFRSVFPFALFNAVQSKSFDAIYKTNDNLVLAAPTGSGKTAILELAICRLVSGHKNDQFKIVYQAPTKSLCSERQRDWQAKFGPLNLPCAELTGDTDQAQLHNVQNASIIITTPEKWDSMTRKWTDHQKLMQMVKLFLIDEVHILKDTRGATLEAVVSRMKSVGSSVRFVALSATVPNSEDIATWLGKDSSNQHLPAHRETFGEDFRPVKLQKFVYGYQSNGNDFSFDKVCESKLPEIISKHSHKKPIMVFCCTRNSAIQTAKMLANLWITKTPRDRQWPAPTQQLMIRDAALRECASSGVAFHHAGIEGCDRVAVEKAYLEGQISVICCTSTLAVGVNLPCHLVIVKNTVSWQGTACKEYADLEVMQMLGRAGRPQFDDSAVAVIMTRKEKVRHYEKMVSGQEILESCLHLNLIDHLNAEVGLGTISDLHTAKRWLAGTFLYVRLRQNPEHYKLESGTRTQSLDENIEQICRRDIELLKETELISAEGKLKSTEFGDAMSRYYIKFETMKIFLSLKEKAKMSEILSALAQADEFHELRLKGNEKSLYKEINRANSIKFPIKVDLALYAHKVSLIIQFELGGVEFPTGEPFQKLKVQFQQDKGIIFQHVHRLIRCIVDCQIYLKDSVAIRHALELARSLGAKVWDNSPLQLKQIEQIGLVAVRKLVTAGVNSIEALEDTEAYRIEMILSRNPPFGSKILSKLKDFPKLRVFVTIMGKDVKPGQPVRVRAKADVGFMNEKVPLYFNQKPIYVVFLAETSDGDMLDFRRIHAKKLDNGQDVLFTAELSHVTQYITCYVMCDDIAGTMKYAELKPNLPASLFPAPKPKASAVRTNHALKDRSTNNPSMNTSRRRSIEDERSSQAVFGDDMDEFDDDGLDDGDFVAAVGDLDFNHIDGYDSQLNLQTRANTLVNKKANDPIRASPAGGEEPWEPVLLKNGKWACNHACKDKTSCKHMCCRDGLDKPPKAPKKPAGPSKLSTQQLNPTSSGAKLKQQSLSLTKGNKHNDTSTDIETVDLANVRDRGDYAKVGPREYRKLDRLHSSVQKAAPLNALPQKPKFSYLKDSQPELSFLKKSNSTSTKHQDPISSDYGSDWLEDMPSPSTLVGDNTVGKKVGQHETAVETPSRFDDDLSSLEECMIGLDDSIEVGKCKDNTANQALPSLEDDFRPQYADDDQGLNWSSSPVRRQQAPQLAGVAHGSGHLPSSLHKGQSIFLSTPSTSDHHNSTSANVQTTKRLRERSRSITASPSASPPLAKKQKLSEDLEVTVDRPCEISNADTSVQSTDPVLQEGDEGYRRPGWEGIDQELYDMFKDIVDIVPEGENV